MEKNEQLSAFARERIFRLGVMALLVLFVLVYVESRLAFDRKFSEISRLHTQNIFQEDKAKDFFLQEHIQKFDQVLSEKKKQLRLWNGVSILSVTLVTIIICCLINERRCKVVRSKKAVMRDT